MNSSPNFPLRLEPHAEVSRPMSVVEYLHASMGQSPRTLDGEREVIFILEGRGGLPADRWQQALDQVVAVNPGTRLRIVGKRHRARLQSDGEPIRLRVVRDCPWDGQSEVGAEFLTASRLRLDGGPLGELIVAESGDRCRVVLRVNHLAMDGRGAIHFFHELFRALRGEPLVGSNANFSDVDLMRAVGARRSVSRWVKPATLTGAPRGRELGDRWRRLSIEGGGKQTLSRLVTAAAESARRHDTRRSCLFILPVDLRRHLPGLNSTQNFTSALMVELKSDEDAGDFRRKLQHMLDHKMETRYHAVSGLFKALPMGWVDWLVSRKPGSFHRKDPMQTLVISHLGNLEPERLSCDGFHAEGIFGVPLPGDAFCFVFRLGNRVEVIVGLPEIYANEGRLDEFMALLAQRLADEPVVRGEPATAG